MQSNLVKIPRPKSDLIPKLKKKKKKIETIPMEGMGLMMVEAWTVA